jgi:LAS superfamily LD-carboxypeptidase LdcB
MAGKQKRRPVGIDTGIPTSVWEGPDPAGTQVLGLGIEHGSAGDGGALLIDKLHLEAQFSYQPTITRLGSMHLSRLDAVPSDSRGYDQFRDAVMAQQIRNNEAKGLKRAEDLPEEQLAIVKEADPSKHKPAMKLRKDAAAAALILMAAARKAVGASSAVDFGSAYRNLEYDKGLWIGYFTKYYWETLHRRRQFHGGPLGPMAVVFMAHHVAKWKAAPGYSNHSRGIAIDFHYAIGTNSLSCEHSPASLKAWSNTPLYKWLTAPTDSADRHARAQDFGFYPYEPEPWHWEYYSSPEEYRKTHPKKAPKVHK